MDFIQLKENNIKRFGIKTAEGIDTGNYIEFDIEDIELPLRINESDKMHKNNLMDLKNKLIILEKKQDKRGKNILSHNEEEKIKLFKEFYEKEEKALDLFIGEGGTRKLLNGRKPYYSMYDDISEMLKPIMPIIQQNAESIKENIIKKYSTKGSDVLESNED